MDLPGGGKAVFADLKHGGETPFAYTIDASKTPKVIDFAYEGPVAALNDASQYGIYKVEGGQLTICLTLRGRPRRTVRRGSARRRGGSC